MRRLLKRRLIQSEVAVAVAVAVAFAGTGKIWMDICFAFRPRGKSVETRVIHLGSDRESVYHLR